MAEVRVEMLRFNPAPTQLTQRGMLGWLTLRVGDLVVDGLSLREGRDGTLNLSFPIRTDLEGRRHAVVRPVDDEARKFIEGQVLAALGFKGDSA